MENVKKGMLALALVAAFGGAYATKLANAPKATDPVYNWTRTNGSTIPGEQAPFNGKTVDEAIQNYGCETGLTECARGVDPLEENPDEVLSFN